MVRESSARPALDPRLVTRLHRRSGAFRWEVSEAQFAATLEASAERASGSNPSARDLERYLEALHLQDLALACACALGCEAAWDHFVLEHRPVLYRAADALAPGGGAREAADSLYAELYGLQERDGGRRSLFRYFHGRSSLATWLRAVLAQRYVDRVRAERRIEPLPDEEVTPARAAAPDPDRARYLALIQHALTLALAKLSDRDRLRLAFYYAQQLTLAETGRLLNEHEATVSRHIAKARATIRKHVEHRLAEAGLPPDEVGRCFASVVEDAGPLDLGTLLGRSGAMQADGG